MQKNRIFFKKPVVYLYFSFTTILVFLLILVFSINKKEINQEQVSQSEITNINRQINELRQDVHLLKNRTDSFFNNLVFNQKNLHSNWERSIRTKDWNVYYYDGWASLKYPPLVMKEPKKINDIRSVIYSKNYKENNNGLIDEGYRIEIFKYKAKNKIEEVIKCIDKSTCFLLREELGLGLNEKFINGKEGSLMTEKTEVGQGFSALNYYYWSKEDQNNSVGVMASAGEIYVASIIYRDHDEVLPYARDILATFFIKD